MTAKAADSAEFIPSTAEVVQNKRIFFIRHAESENNVAKEDAAIAWRNMKSLSSLPTSNQWSSIGSMMFIPMNTDLSDLGEKMVANLRHYMNETSFLTTHKVELVVHSPLIRAQRTCSILFEHTG